MFFIGGLSLVGIPPTNGFSSKRLLFKNNLAAEQLWTLLLIGIADILTLVYTIRALMRIWWLTPAGEIATKDRGRNKFPIWRRILVRIQGA
ncbi:MAG: hypothetical protein GY859_10280 [Desulfobacterales bacterium]|nr:hypothetical protein [Desulfobacterales bacterium]